MVFQDRLEHCKMAKRKHLRKWEWWPNGPHFHFEAQQSLTSGKNNVWILQFLFLPPLLLLRPQVPPILKPEASLIRPMVFLSRGTDFFIWEFRWCSRASLTVISWGTNRKETDSGLLVMAICSGEHKIYVRYKTLYKLETGFILSIHVQTSF